MQQQVALLLTTSYTSPSSLTTAPLGAPCLQCTPLLVPSGTCHPAPEPLVLLSTSCFPLQVALVSGGWPTSGHTPTWFVHSGHFSHRNQGGILGSSKIACSLYPLAMPKVLEGLHLTQVDQVCGVLYLHCWDIDRYLIETLLYSIF